jgi:oligopeptide/dipeptide ABC transporter ATP-binding protein
VLISHNLAVVEQLCEETAVLYLGRIVEHGPTNGLLERPAHPYTLALRSAVPEIDLAARRSRIVLPGSVPDPADPPPGCPFHPRCPYANDRSRTEAPTLRPVAPGRAPPVTASRRSWPARSDRVHPTTAGRRSRWQHGPGSVATPFRIWRLGPQRPSRAPTHPRRSPAGRHLAATQANTTIELVSAVTAWKFLHIASMFVAVSIFVGQGMLSGAVARSGDVRALRRVLATEDRFAPIGGGIFLLGIVFGFLAAITGDFDLTQTWLLIGYGLALFILVNGFVYHMPQAAKLKAAAEASPDDRPSEELRALIDTPSAGVVNAIDGIAWLALIYVMVAKPFT